MGKTATGFLLDDRPVPYEPRVAKLSSVLYCGVPAALFGRTINAGDVVVTSAATATSPSSRDVEGEVVLEIRGDGLVKGHLLPGGARLTVTGIRAPEPGRPLLVRCTYG